MIEVINKNNALQIYWIKFKKLIDNKGAYRLNMYVTQCLFISIFKLLVNYL